MLVQVVVRLCNVCMDKDRETTRYEIHSEDRRVVYDFCQEHGVELERLIEEGEDEEPTPGARTRRRGSRGRPTMTMEEIEALKNSGG